jgi:hypothetical protein
MIVPTRPGRDTDADKARDENNNLIYTYTIS